MKSLMISLFVFSSLISSCQIHWGKASDWTIYGYQGSRMFKLSLDSLRSLDTLKMDQDSVNDYLTSAHTLKSEPGVWMGGFITTCVLDGEIRKVDFSNYGNFFYDEKSRTYYELSTEKAEPWLSYIQNCLVTLAHKKAK